MCFPDGPHLRPLPSSEMPENITAVRALGHEDHMAGTITGLDDTVARLYGT